MKRCTKCKLNKPKGDFGKNKHRADGLQTECRECKRQSNREYYSKNKTHHVKVCAAIKRRRVKETHKWMLDYLLKHPCIDCGEQDPRCLEFDHVKDKKKYNVSCMAGLGYGIKSIQREIDKCEVRCANCHRKKTAEEMRWFTSLRARS